MADAAAKEEISNDGGDVKTAADDTTEPTNAQVRAAAESLLRELGVEDEAESTAESGASGALDAAGVPRFYVIVHNVAKKSNIGMLMRSAGAFGVKEILIVGQRNNMQYFGAQGALHRVSLRYLSSLEEAVSFVRERNCHIYGIEIKDEAKSVAEEPFAAGKNAAFFLGNEGMGLSPSQCRVCDSFVYIPHYGDATESLNVTMAGTVVFHRFAAWAKYPEHGRTGEKFHVKETVRKRGINTLEEAEKHVRRNWKKFKSSDEVQQS
ncbi:23S rRNA Guanosine-2'-O--methyltransferase [Hondaea fermentalgiana]|uniref:23S rRNA Guanosine-2'-O--methyltransferase n=1 Tax=Hondaea fermentalgiana TaxID=2315210 RepID=A0A2R5H0R9_9STRA|nr:23S rRNA Guanosine-2'-O--methyltransferase [Hondaea fermentalgiana]|eukprot:GBG33914.1 23S rRNA Guanosine-2'-O--methyltransferase [Hondaea fermentalgiana]